MKVFLITDFEGLMSYRNGDTVFEAAGEFSGRRNEYFYRIEVDVEEIQGKAGAVGHVLVKRKPSEDEEEVVQPTQTIEKRYCIRSKASGSYYIGDNQNTPFFGHSLLATLYELEEGRNKIKVLEEKGVPCFLEPEQD